MGARYRRKDWERRRQRARHGPHGTADSPSATEAQHDTVSKSIHSCCCTSLRINAIECERTALITQSRTSTAHARGARACDGSPSASQELSV